MLRRATHLVERARERIRTASEPDPHAWPPRGDTRAILVHDDEPETPDAAPDGNGAVRPPLGSPAPGAPDVDVASGPVSGPPQGARRGTTRTTRRTAGRDDGDTVPSGLRVAADWSWRVILVGALLYLLVRVVDLLFEVFVPLLVALLLAALLQPGAAALIRRRWPRSLAALVMLLVGVLVVAGIITLVVEQVVTDWSSLTGQVSQGLTQIQDTITRTFPITQHQLNQLVGQVQNAIGANQSAITSGAISTAGTVTSVFAGLLLTLLTLFFFLKDGRSIWLWVVGLMPHEARAYVDEAARRSWRTLVALVRATVAVALMDAVGIGAALLVLGVPLALPLAALVFIGAFIPIVGSFLAGTVAVLVALVSNGLVTALLTLGAVVLVMQLEGHVFSPLLLGRAVRIHPLAVVLGLATGVIIGGIFGALIAVPIIACLNVGGTYLVHRHDGPRPPEPHPERARPAVTAG
ncbi:AI-2E family transporter [Geodermatophilus sp. TF02-6]|uniref:AI-2E family transporter n=1 Tax=Geodermatophilus sp. TF02-6 TaxID=2250575 RepID=UPI000DE8193E|nr:AI-2E family transporter [Geodermatophilus sp. TF02-6]RBY81731.1 AI-2E family transporter [Geodermatophilus sp. TF02-6]